MDSKATVILHRCELGKLLGQGTFAKVYHAKNIQTGASVAIKIIDKEKILKVGLIKQIKHEISVMRLIRHQNIVELYEVMATKTKIYFVMEYARGGELYNKIAKGKLKEDVARKYFQQLISALDYCHCRRVGHRDLKPENLLLDENDNVKVSDFGLSTLVASSHKDGLLHTTCGTPAYVAPEVMNKNGYDGVKSDIWSCGVILFVLLAGYLPFRDSNLTDMYRKIVKGHFKIPNWFAPEVRKLLSKILDPNPNTRITIAKIMANPWFRKGLDPKPVEIDIQGKELVPLDSDALLGATEDPGVIVGSKQELARPSNLNAFDIISYSTGFDLSGLFEETNRKKEARFLSNKPASTIISMLEEIAKRLKLKLRKKEGGKLKLEVSEHVRKGALGMDVEIFEVTPCIHVVEVKKSNGETIEYQKVMNQDIKPALRDIVWTWQGEEQQQRQEEDKEVNPSNVKLQVDSPMES